MITMIMMIMMINSPPPIRHRELYDYVYSLLDVHPAINFKYFTFFLKKYVFNDKKTKILLEENQTYHYVHVFFFDSK